MDAGLKVNAHYIAMWSGPRNISTAMMRSWGNRPDTFVCDEPFYAHYLLTTRHIDHPGYSETISSHNINWQRVVQWLTGPIPQNKCVFYQKHMAHHLLPGMAIDWIDKLTNCFLIRDPNEMLLSLTEFLPTPTVEETGLPQQVALFERIADQTGSVPPVLDARDTLTDPAGLLQELCDRVGLPFDERMLSWPPGPRSTDGVWAPHWYAKVYETTGFGAYRSKSGRLPDSMLSVLEQCQVYYDQLARHRIRTPLTERSAPSTPT